MHLSKLQVRSSILFFHVSYAAAAVRLVGIYVCSDAHRALINSQVRKMRTTQREDDSTLACALNSGEC